MRIRSWSLLAAAALALGQLSCATVNMTPLPESMPAARAALAPEYRIFYDALADYGDWVLIEPYGYVFRPVDNVIGWRPYQDGYWAASDVYGWVWISAEPFGWATYHYGDWFYDRYQGWVWLPGVDWAPAWVSWAQTADYVGWAPLFPSGYDASVPGGSYLYVPIGQLAATDLKVHVLTTDGVGVALGSPQPVKDVVERDGVRFNRGPSIEEIEKHSGPLARVKIDDVAIARTPVAGNGGSPTRPGAGMHEIAKPSSKPTPAVAGNASAALEAMRRAAEESARQARSVSESQTAPPAEVYLPRPVGRRAEKSGSSGTREAAARKGGAGTGGTRASAKGKSAPADTTRH